VSHNPPVANDFKPYRITKPSSIWGTNECEACGLSVCGTLEGAENFRNAVPAFRKQHIAQGRITVESGKMLETFNHNNPTHITWWVYDNIELHMMFNIA
jgi:hypothetical protein